MTKFAGRALRAAILGASFLAAPAAIAADPGVVFATPLGSHDAMSYYPASAARLAEFGTVMLLFVIQADGSVTDIRVSASSGFADLDQAAINAAKTWRYNPATLNGKPIAVQQYAQVQFTPLNHNWLFGESDDSALCRDGGATPEKRIAACGAAIKDSRTNDSDRIIALGIRAGQLALIGDDAGAFKDLDEVVHLTPNNPLAWFERGRNCFYRKDYPAAAADFQQALRLKPDFSESLGWLYRTHMEMTKFADAVADMDRALALKPGDAGLLVSRAVASVARKDYAAAIADYDSVIAAQPNAVSVYVWRGSAKVTAGQKDAGLADLATAIALDPKSPYVYAARGETLRRVGQPQSALADFDKALALKPNDARMLRERGDAQAALRHADRAIADLDAAVAADPGNAVYRNERCWTRATFDRELDAALEDCNKALELAPGTASYLDSRGFVYFRQGKFALAIADDDAALGIAPSSAPTLYVRGLAEAKAGDADASKADIAAAIAADPGVVKQFAGYGVKP